MSAARQAAVTERSRSVDQVLWAIAQIADKAGPWGYAEIEAGGAAVSRPIVTRAVRGWVEAGLVEVVRDTRPILHRIAAAALNRALPVGRTAEDNLWSTMRGLKSFRPTDLAAHSSTDTVPVSVAAAAAYCRDLLAAEFLVVVEKAVPGRREAIYRLVRNTGPHAPQPRRVRAVVDRNAGETVLIETGLKGRAA